MFIVIFYVLFFFINKIQESPKFQNVPFNLDITINRCLVFFLIFLFFINKTEEPPKFQNATFNLDVASKVSVQCASLTCEKLTKYLVG